MGRRKKAEPQDKKQSAKFISAAKKIKDDNDKEKFEKAFHQIIKAKRPSVKKIGKSSKLNSF
ncbi:MAG: hypothetical protein ABSG44_06610 [Thermodesulfobacteriota bacterium]|jgi:hypothetical protein